MKPPNWKIFSCELLVYAVLVFAYFVFVLHYLGDWLFDLFQHNRTTFALMALVLMIGQAVGLEAISSLLFRLMQWKSK
jgi:Kef-type K+ transport system membrane component KefB